MKAKTDGDGDGRSHCNPVARRLLQEVYRFSDEQYESNERKVKEMISRQLMKRHDLQNRQQSDQKPQHAEGDTRVSVVHPDRNEKVSSQEEDANERHRVGKSLGKAEDLASCSRQSGDKGRSPAWRSGGTA